jgi:putative peptidoglycan lipid II flippase
VFKHSAIVTGLSGLGNVTAPLVDMVIAAQYGLGSKTDALFVALTIPQLVAALLLVSFNVTLVPIFSTIKVEEGTRSLWRFASNLASICLVALGLIAVLGAFSSRLLVSLVAPGLDPDTQQLAHTLSALLFLMLVPLGAVEVIKALLNALHSFGPPAATNLLRNGAIIAAALLFRQRWDIRAVALGYVIGAWLQLLMVSVALLGKGFRYTPRLSWREALDRKVWHSLRLPLLGGAMNLSNTLIERFLVSFLPAGTISALGLARRILWAADSVFLGSIATVLLPRLSDQSARQNEDPYRRYLNLGLKLSLLVAVPITAGAIVLSVPAVRTIFERGAFGEAATRATATYLRLYMLGLPASALIQILLAGFYARQNTVTPFYVLAAMLALTLVFDVGLFAAIEARGLALGLSLAKLSGSALAFYLLTRNVGRFAQRLGRFALQVLVASLALVIATAAAMYGVRQVTTSLLVTPRLTTIAAALELVIGGVVGVAAYAVAALVLRIEQASEAAHLVKVALAARRRDKAASGAHRLARRKLAEKPFDPT